MVKFYVKGIASGPFAKADVETIVSKEGMGFESIEEIQEMKKLILDDLNASATGGEEFDRLEILIFAPCR